MMKILCLHVASHRPSYRYRVESFLPYWKNYDVCFDRLCVSGVKSIINVIKSILVSSNYDYIWIQRKVFPVFLLRLIVRRGRLIFDFDDAIYVKQVVLTGEAQSETPRKLKRIECVLKKSKIVFAGSEYLKSYADRYSDNVHLIPTPYIKQDLSHEECKIGDEVTIGWIGSNSNMFYLKIVDKALRSLQLEYPHVKYSLMSGINAQKLETEWEFVEWSTKNEKQWLSGIDIGIMPLTDDEWSRGKCAFKLLQYMAYGKAVVASDVGANKSVVKNGLNGFLASNTVEWRNALEKLILDKQMRVAFGYESKMIFDSFYERNAVQKRIVDLLEKHKKDLHESVTVR